MIERGEAGAFRRFQTEEVAGYLHPAPDANGYALLLSHGAGSDCRAPLLVSAASAFAAAGYAVLRYDLAFRQRRPNGPPGPGDAARDRDGIRRAVEAMRAAGPKGVYLGGHSYGGRQSTILAAEEPGLAHGLLLLSYPLHPPRQPERLRTGHFPSLRTRALFIHGQRDPFGTAEELRAALALIPAATGLELLPGGHDLAGFGREAARVVAAFSALMGV